MYLKRFTIILLVCLFSSAIFCQQEPEERSSPYEISRQKDLSLIGVGIGLKLTGEILKGKVQALTEAQILRLNKNDLNAFDRTATDNYSGKARDASDVFQYASYGFSLLLLLDKDNQKDYLSISTMAVEVWLINSGLTDITKSFVKRNRPFVFNPNVSVEEKMKQSSRLSFYSGHTSKVASMSFLTAKLFSDYYPDSKWKPVVWTTAVLLPATTGFLRYKGGKHYPSDVIVGLAAGALVGLAIPTLHRPSKNNKLSLSVLPTNEGLGLVMRW